MNVRFGMCDDEVSRARANRVVDALRAALAGSASSRVSEVAVVPVTIEPETGLAEDDPELLVAALRVALISGECDAVIHDAAALPLDESSELAVAAYLPGREARLAFCSAGAPLEDLDDGSLIVVRDNRVAAQVARLGQRLVTQVDGADLAAVLARVESGEAAGAVVALCDVDVTGAEPAFLAALDVADVVPSAAQGVVAIEMRADAPEEIARLLAALDDSESRAAVTAERAAMRGLAAGPADPVSAYATVVGDDLHLHVRVTNPSGTLVLNDESHGPMSDPEFLGSNSAKLLLGRGAARVMRMT